MTTGWGEEVTDGVPKERILPLFPLRSTGQRLDHFQDQFNRQGIHQQESTHNQLWMIGGLTVDLGLEMRFGYKMIAKGEDV